MDRLFRRRRIPAAFTLVEMLTVIVIIGILSGALLVAVNAVRTRATQSVVLMQITELGRALETHKAEVGAYPPDFAGVNHLTDAGVRNAARARVIAHLRKAFPKYRPIGDGSMTNNWDKFCYDVTLRYPNVDPTNFDASAALVFWLGGLPERVGDRNKPAGFHSDPRMPFKPGLPRTDPPFKFSPDDLLLAPTGIVQFSPHRLHEKTPVIYFRSYRSVAGLFEYGYDVGGTFEPKVYPWRDQYGGTSICVPYLEPSATNRNWRNLETYQIICAGSDGSFGQTTYRYTKSGDGFTQGDFDNLTNFYTPGDLEGELQ